MSTDDSPRGDSGRSSGPRAEARSDGGSVESDSPFHTVSDTQVSRRQELWRKFDRSIVAPMRILWSDWRGRLGIAIVLAYVLMGTVGVILVPEPATDIEHRYVLPFQSLKYPLGTGIAGKSLFAEVVYATPPMLKMILSGGVFAILVGAGIGMVAGYKGGLIDQALMLVTDTLMTLPGLPLVIVLSFLLEPRSPYIIGVILAINNWTGLARAVRSQLLPLRDAPYVEASRTMGVPLPTILKDDILPNLMPYIAVNFVGASRRIIFESVALYFLGILPTSQPNWGVMMNTAHKNAGAVYSLESAHLLLVPMAAVVGISLGFILLSQSADRLFNPRLRARHQQSGDADSGGPQEEEESGSTTIEAH